MSLKENVARLRRSLAAHVAASALKKAAKEHTKALKMRMYSDEE